MIGMNQIKKRLINGILIGLGIGLVIVIVILIITNNIVKGYEKGTSEKFNEQYMTTVQTFNRNVTQGEEITEEMVQDTLVPKTTVPRFDENEKLPLKDEIVGNVAKYNVPMKVAITRDMFAKNIVGTDVRIQEINSIVMPSDLAVGEYVDIRIMMPSGVEYIVLAQKKIKDIVSTTIKIDLSEEEILLLNSAIVDSYLTKGSKLYAVKYTDPTTQIKVNKEDMENAKTYITNKIVSDLMAEGAIQKNMAVATSDDTNTESDEIENSIEEQSNLIGDIISGVTNTEAAETKNTDSIVAATSDETKQDKYTLEVGELKADKLIDMITEYAIEYRYYVESYNKVEANYQPNDEVRKFMLAHKNIVEEAKKRLNEDTRRGIEASIKNFENDTGDSYDNITTKIEESINTQKSLRQSVLGNKTTTAQ